MKLKKIALQNFKCFQEAEIEFSDITILTGQNSSGKSSVINAILGTLQSLEFPTDLNLNGEWIMMGDFSEVITNHDKRKNFGISLTLTENDNSNALECKTTFQKDRRSSAPQLKNLDIQHPLVNIKYNQEPSGNYKASYKTEAIENGKGDDDIRFRGIMADFFTAINALSPEEKSKKSKKNASLDKIAEAYRNPKGEGSFTCRDSNDFRTKLYQDAPWISGKLDVMKAFRADFNYISPFRLSPERTYYTKAKANLNVDRFGANAIEQIANWSSTKSKKLQELQLALKKIGLSEAISVRRLLGGRFEIRINFGATKMSSSLVDVGFGISQFLPILVADLQLASGGTLAISQPEIHLHPSAQAHYADHIVERLNKVGRRVIIETHSECLINRLRRCVAQGKLKEEQISMYHFEKNSSELSSCTRIQLKKNGSLSGAPKNFFETYLMDSMALALEGSKS